MGQAQTTFSQFYLDIISFRIVWGVVLPALGISAFVASSAFAQSDSPEAEQSSRRPIVAEETPENLDEAPPADEELPDVGDEEEDVVAPDEAGREVNLEPLPLVAPETADDESNAESPAPKDEIAADDSKDEEIPADSESTSEVVAEAKEAGRAFALVTAKGFELSIGGFLRVGGATIFPDRFVLVSTGTAGEQNPNVGRFDGFALGAARLNFRATYKKLLLRLTFDGAVQSYQDEFDAVGILSTLVRDAYLGYRFNRYASITVGRFKPPFDTQELTTAAEQLFVHRALESRGVLRHEGFSGDVPGFAPGRQVGVMVHADRAISMGPLDMGYALAITNGVGEQWALNDNDLPAVFLRLHWATKDESPRDGEEGPSGITKGEGVRFGLGGFFNELSTGDAPDIFRDQVFGASVDFRLRYWLIEFEGQVIWTQTEHLLRNGSASENAIGGHASLAFYVPKTGLSIAYRYAGYNPRFIAAAPNDRLSDLLNYDTVMHHTVGLRYIFDELPLGLWAEYTHSDEEGGRAIDNDRLEAAVQVSF